MKYIWFVLIFILIFYQYFHIKKAQVSTITINQTTFEIEIADNDTKRQKGLSGRDKLDEKDGMLFIFPRSDYYNFWMNEMKIPLDFVWIDGNKVIDLTENVQIPKDNKELSLFSSKKPANKILEVNAGIIKKYSIKIGDIVEISLI
jgi:uncharacterized membrane protein (UPF0127 family)